LLVLACSLLHGVDIKLDGNLPRHGVHSTRDLLGYGPCGPRKNRHFHKLAQGKPRQRSFARHVVMAECNQCQLQLPSCFPCLHASNWLWNLVLALTFKAAACFKMIFWALSLEAVKAKSYTVGCRIVVPVVFKLDH
jgi:hypothetical protein